MSEPMVLDLVKQIGVIMRHYELSMKQSRNVMVKAENELNVSLNTVRTDTKQLLKDTKTQITLDAKNAVEAALSSELSTFEKRVKEAVNSIEKAASYSYAEKKALAKTTWILSLIAMGCIGIVSIGSVTVAGYFVKQRLDEYNSMSYPLAVKKASQTIKFASCGGKPCIKLNENATKYGDYIIVEQQGE